MSRRQFLRRFGIASGALTFSPFFIDRFASVARAASPLTRVFKVMNGDCFQNTAKIWDLLGGPARYINPTDVVVIKANAQWINQGYTHTGCIKGVIDAILAIPGFSGEVLICDNTQSIYTPEVTAFGATTANRVHNYPDDNWNSLAASYVAAGKQVAAVRWFNDSWRDVPSIPYYSEWNPASGSGWTRSYFNFYGRNTYLSYPIFLSPFNSSRLIDPKKGVWEGAAYSGRRVRTIVMPTLNNHGDGSGDYAGMTSAVKSFFGATEIHWGTDSIPNGYYHMHSSTYSTWSASAPSGDPALHAGELTGRYLNTFFAPQLYITAAMWSGTSSRTGGATETKTVLACENPVSLDYISARDVISPYSPWLNPDSNTYTRQQLIGCSSQGIGTLDPQQIEVVSFDFNNPTATRLDVERKIRDYKAGKVTSQDVKDAINLYMDSP